jgi:hypothetical protein
VVGVDSPGTPWHDAFAMLEVRGEYSVAAGEIQTRPGDQGGQPGDEVERFQHHVGRAITEGLLVTVHDPALAIDGEALGGNGWAGDVAAQAFQAIALIRFTNGGSVQGDKIAGSDFEQPKAGPKGGGQDARSNPATLASRGLSEIAANGGTLYRVSAG